ncbi:hypothetical protein EVJ58_g10845, partial [Rhodofomes roseus]
FGKPADAIEKSVENADECAYAPPDAAPYSHRGRPARVTAHNTPTDQLPNRTTILIKLEKSVIDREEALKT